VTLIDLATHCPSFRGTMQELLQTLAPFRQSSTSRTDWSKTPRALSCQLRHLAPQLRSIGIDIEFVRDGQSRIVTVAMSEGGDASAIDHRSTIIGERLKAYIHETSRPVR
jgi:hypothetical protein